ncbi:MAG: hypothetical protein WCB61_17800, partial [Pseudolabrys sp.]
VLGDARLRDLKPELSSPWMRGAPQSGFSMLSPDQSAQLRADLRAPTSQARFPAPIAAKAGPMFSLG